MAGKGGLTELQRRFVREYAKCGKAICCDIDAHRRPNRKPRRMALQANQRHHWPARNDWRGNPGAGVAAEHSAAGAMPAHIRSLGVGDLRMKAPRFRWTKQLDDRLRREYPHATDSVRLAKAFGCGLNALRMRAYRLGLAKSDEVRNELCRMSLGREVDECEASPRIEVLPGDAPGIVRIVRHRLMK
jgi:hypothetical protein